MTPAGVAAAREALAGCDSALARAHAATGPFEWRFKTRGFQSLAKIIVEQQVSTASADAIWGRLEAGLGAVTPEAVMTRDEARLKAFGLSSQKARYVRGVAEAWRPNRGVAALLLWAYYRAVKRGEITPPPAQTIRAISDNIS